MVLTGVGCSTYNCVSDLFEDIFRMEYTLQMKFILAHCTFALIMWSLSISTINFLFFSGGYVSLKQAMISLLPEIFCTNFLQDEGSSKYSKDTNAPSFEDENVNLRLVRIQGIELDMDIPFFWVANCLKNPEFYLHICVFISKQPELR
jgi:Autophagy protein Apg5